jgi:hypothetical protein
VWVCGGGTGSSTILYRFGIMAGGYAILEYVNIVEMIRSKTAKKKGGKAHGREDQKPKTEDRRRDFLLYSTT